jgi:hypothetical protein
MSTSRVIVFAGPSLPPSLELPDGCEVRPPARRGDVLAAMADGPDTLVLLDGYYYTVPSVTHKELLYALDAGVRVIGAASLGALRAVELAPFGMVGAGRVFEAYRDGSLDGDDEVALLHAPAEHGYRPLTVALVEVRFALERLVEEGAVPAAEAARLIDSLKALPFTAREPRRIAELAGEGIREALERTLAGFSVKQQDSRRALELAMEGPAPSPKHRHPRTRTGYLSAFKAGAIRGLSGDPDLPGATVAHAWNLAQLFHPGAAGFVRRVRTRALRAAAATRVGIETSPAREAKRAEALRRCHLRRLGRLCLPEPEYLEEARLQVLAREARRRMGEDGALAALARHLGLDPAVEGMGFLDHLALQPNLVPTWEMARAFTFTAAFRPALEAAAEAEEVHRCFQRWADGSRVAKEDLYGLAATLWDCAPDKVVSEAAKRGLFVFSDLTDGLDEALELIAAAERLPEPINRYPEKRDLLIGWSRRSCTS